MNIWFQYYLGGSTTHYVRAELPDDMNIPGALESIAAAGFTELKVKVGDCNTLDEVSARLSSKTIKGLSSCLRTKGAFNPNLLYAIETPESPFQSQQVYVDRLLSLAHGPG